MRKPQVTRTIVTTRANVMCLEINTGECVNKEFVAPRTYKDNEKLLKVLKQSNETEELKLVHIVDVQTEETLYGMPEEEFIKSASILPPRTKAE